MSTSYRQLKVPELKELLAKRGLPVSGKKEELVARLLAAEDKKPVETINQTSRSSSNTNPARKSSIENIINKDPVEQTDLFDKELNLMATTDITTGIDNDFDWENLTTDITLQKDGEFDTLISPISPSLSVTSIKELSPEKAKTENAEATKESHDVTNVEAKQSVETKNPSFNEAKTLKTESSSSNPDSIVKPSGFKCKKIVFDNLPTTTAPLSPSKSQTDLATELERRKKRAERFGVELSDSDKKLQRAARFGTTISNPLDAPLTAPRMPNRKPSVVEDDEKLKKRAERFGLDKSNTLNDDEKKRKRAERFGLNTPSNSASIDNSSTNSVSEINEEEKKKRRAERFSINDTNGEPTNKKVKT
uniref:SAP domain-containing ribonucleoprotein n=1 Tax=Anthurium amnicola TaxID=1678845 RepID=A0A1D1XKX4_9ARAE